MVIAVIIQGRPSSAPQGWTTDFKVVQRPSFADGVSAVSTLIFACSATPAYFSIAAEMRDLRYFNRAVFVSQLGSTILYVAVGATVYYYCGTMVASPALGSAGPLVKNVSYGIALPGLIASTTIVIHVSLYSHYGGSKETPFPRLFDAHNTL